MSNLLDAIYRMATNPIIRVREYYTGKNRANSSGEALENYVQDLFADSLEIEEEAERYERFNETFSYLGNQNNPPDIMLRDGDAIETKKVESPNSQLALNSSYPKAKLLSTSPLLTMSCRICEKWKIKDIIYAVGNIPEDSLNYLWFVYGDCFCASHGVYERIREIIYDGINVIPGVEFSLTKELGKVKKVDPLGITDLRIRGLWHIMNPHKVFQYLDLTDANASFQLFALMRSEKFERFPEASKNSLLAIENENFQMRDVRIKNPDNPADLIDAKLITFKIIN